MNELMSVDISLDSLNTRRKDTIGHFEQGQGLMQQSELKGVLENDWKPPRNTQFNEAAQRRSPGRDSLLLLNMKIIVIMVMIKKKEVVITMLNRDFIFNPVNINHLQQ